MKIDELPVKLDLLRRLAAFAPLAVFVVAWHLYSSGSPSREFYFSSPLAVIGVLIEDLGNGSLQRHASITLFEALAGFILGNFVGTFMGLSLWYSSFLAKLSKPYLVTLGAIPVFALGPLTIIWFGVGILAKVVLAFLATVFVAALTSFTGAEQVNSLYIKRARVYGASNYRIFRSIILPASVVWVISSLRLTIGLALLGAFIGEFIASDAGLGYMIIRASGLYDTPRVFAGVLVIALIALTLDLLIGKLERSLLRWRR